MAVKDTSTFSGMKGSCSTVRHSDAKWFLLSHCSKIVNCAGMHLVPWKRNEIIYCLGNELILIIISVQNTKMCHLISKIQ